VARHLLIAITGHGFGHAAQTAPVVDALRVLRPDLQISVRSDLPEARIQQFFRGAAVSRPTADYGIPMTSAIDVDVPAAERLFMALHAQLDATIATEAAALRDLAPDLVLANVGYVPIAAAVRAGIPAVGFCSLNWHGILRGYDDDWEEGRRIEAEMAACYRQATRFIRPTPAMPMSDLETMQVGPVARRGTNRRDALSARLGLNPADRVVLVSLGGIDTRLSLLRWPVVPHVRYVVAGLPTPSRPDMIALERTGLSHLDCLASCDAVVTKPGYGTVAEAGCHNVPTLYVARGTWPEEPYLVHWLSQNGTAREIARDTLWAGDLADELHALWGMPRKLPPVASGNDEAARLIAELL
jgi:UDP:flavonoid glycosyltransferase YjiC (YdhE family)